MDRESWIVDRGSWIVDRGSFIVDCGLWIVDRGSYILDRGWLDNVIYVVICEKCRIKLKTVNIPSNVSPKCKHTALVFLRGSLNKVNEVC